MAEDAVARKLLRLIAREDERLLEETYAQDAEPHTPLGSYTGARLLEDGLSGRDPDPEEPIFTLKAARR